LTTGTCLMPRAGALCVLVGSVRPLTGQFHAQTTRVSDRSVV